MADPIDNRILDLKLLSTNAIDHYELMILKALQDNYDDKADIENMELATIKVLNTIVNLRQKTK